MNNLSLKEKINLIRMSEYNCFEAGLIVINNYKIDSKVSGSELYSYIPNIKEILKPVIGGLIVWETGTTQTPIHMGIIRNTNLLFDQVIHKRGFGKKGILCTDENSNHIDRKYINAISRVYIDKGLIKNTYDYEIKYFEYENIAEIRKEIKELNKEKKYFSFLSK